MGGIVKLTTLAAHLNAAVARVLTATRMSAFAVHMVGFAARAAYLLGSYYPSLEGIYLAFTNAGYGASLINVFLVTAVWCVPHLTVVSLVYVQLRNSGCACTIA